MRAPSPPPASTRRAGAVAVLLAVSACAAPDQRGVDLARDPGALSLRLADATLAAGSPAVALRILDDEIRRNPDDAAALLRRGKAQAALGQPAAAAQSFAAALAAKPGSLEALTGLARARAASGDAAGAEAAGRSALALAPDDAQVQTSLAIALDLQGRSADAQALYRVVLARKPDDATAKADLGLSLALSGHAAEALPLLQQAAEGGTGGNPAMATRARHNYAVGLAMAGDDPAARRVLAEDLSAAETEAALAGLHQFARAL